MRNLLTTKLAVGAVLLLFVAALASAATPVPGLAGAAATAGPFDPPDPWWAHATANAGPFDPPDPWWARATGK